MLICITLVAYCTGVHGLLYQSIQPMMTHHFLRKFWSEHWGYITSYIGLFLNIFWRKSVTIYHDCIQLWKGYCVTPSTYLSWSSVSVGAQTYPCKFVIASMNAAIANGDVPGVTDILVNSIDDPSLTRIEKLDTIKNLLTKCSSHLVSLIAAESKQQTLNASQNGWVRA